MTLTLCFWQGRDSTALKCRSPNSSITLGAERMNYPSQVRFEMDDGVISGISRVLDTSGPDVHKKNKKRPNVRDQSLI